MRKLIRNVVIHENDIGRFRELLSNTVKSMNNENLVIEIQYQMQGVFVSALILGYDEPAISINFDVEEIEQEKAEPETASKPKSSTKTTTQNK